MKKIYIAMKQYDALGTPSVIEYVYASEAKANEFVKQANQADSKCFYYIDEREIVE